MSRVTHLTPSATAYFRAADVGLVHLYLVAQQTAVRPHHDAPELVRDRPSGRVASDVEPLLELECGEARRVRRDEVRGPEPRGQWRLRAVQDGSSGHRRVATADRY
jgi:hypothetical protein